MRLTKNFRRLLKPIIKKSVIARAIYDAIEYSSIDTPYQYMHLNGTVIKGIKKSSVKSHSDVYCTDNDWVKKDIKGFQSLSYAKFIELFSNVINKAYVKDAALIDEFSTALKGAVAINGDEWGENTQAPNFSIVRGELIAHYYNEGSYANVSGNLGDSCMKHSHLSDVFDIYTNNHENVSMLILRSESFMIVARALVWDIDGNKYMDTIYSSEDTFKQMMIEFACKNKWYYKSRHSCHHHAFDMYDGEQIQPKQLHLQIKITPSDWDEIRNKQKRFPYLDTMMFLSKGKDGLAYLGNTPAKGSVEFYRLRTTSGTFAQLSDEFYEERFKYLFRYATTYYKILWMMTYNMDDILKKKDMPRIYSYIISAYKNKSLNLYESGIKAQALKALKKRPHKGHVFISRYDTPYEMRLEDHTLCTTGSFKGIYVPSKEAVELYGDTYAKSDGRLAHLPSKLYGNNVYELIDNTVDSIISGYRIRKDDAVLLPLDGHVHKEEMKKIKTVELDGVITLAENVVTDVFTKRNIHLRNAYYTERGYTSIDYKGIYNLLEWKLREEGSSLAYRTLDEVSKLIIFYSNNPDKLEVCKKSKTTVDIASILNS